MGKIDLQKIGSQAVHWAELADFATFMMRDARVMCWGTHNLKNYSHRVLRFNVQAHRHVGHVYIYVNGIDLCNVILTKTNGEIVREFSDIYLDQLIAKIDDEIERLPSYRF